MTATRSSINASSIRLCGGFANVTTPTLPSISCVTVAMHLLQCFHFGSKIAATEEGDNVRSCQL